MLNQNPTSTQIESDVLSVRAQIRCAISLLTSTKEYGSLVGDGDSLCDVGFVLMNAEERLSEIHSSIEKFSMHQGDRNGQAA